LIPVQIRFRARISRRSSDGSADAAHASVCDTSLPHRLSWRFGGADSLSAAPRFPERVRIRKSRRFLLPRAVRNCGLNSFESTCLREASKNITKDSPDGPAAASLRITARIGKFGDVYLMPSRSDSPERVLLELAAHDLRNPLSGVLTATQLLIEEASRLLSPDQLILLRSIESSAQFMLRLVDDMVELPQLGAGNAKLELHSVDVGLLVEHVVAASRPLAESRRISMEVGIQRPLAKVTADPVKLVRVLEALLAGSIRSSDEGGGIELLVDLQTEHVVITLSHEAPGHSRDILRALFDTPPSKRAKRRFTEQRAALTLAYARSIVRAHHGTFRLEAGQKGRSSIVISLPVSGRARLRTERKPVQRKDRKMSAGS
jgi:hypothetical protein